MAPQRAAKSSAAVRDTIIREQRIVKLANSIIDPNKIIRFKSLINRDNKKDASTLKDPRLGLTLLQIAVIVDNIPAVEELIALGADVNITVGHQILEKGLLPDLGPDFWELKRQNLLTVHKAYEAVYNSLYGLIHLAVMGGSISAVRFLVNKGYADVNAPAAESGLTPLMCAALCRSVISRRTGELEDMRGMVDLLLELGGDLSRVNIVGNDIVAIAASARDRGLWKDIIADPALLSQCTAKHAGRIALQLFASWNITKDEAIKLTDGQIAQSWCAEMTTMVHAFCDTASMAEACEARKRLVAELSEPVTQRVLWPGEGSKNTRAKPICEIFWPAQAQATTNALCAIMQGMAVPPDPIRVSNLEVLAMLRLLVELGVQPEALLLPRRPGQGKCRMLQPISLEPLAAILAERCNKDLSRHKEVLMDQLWCHLYTSAKYPLMDLCKLDQKNIMIARHLLSTLRTCGVDWTDPCEWPEDLVDGHWERQIPIPFLLEHIKPDRTSSITLIIAICEELAALGNTDFVNTHQPGKTSPMVYAAREGFSAIIQKMIQCGGSPAKQGSNWADFFIAATSTFRPDMAQVIHSMISNPSLLLELQAGCRSAQAKHVQRGSLASQQSFVSWLANNHPGWEALLLPLMNAAPSAKLLHKQCQLALTAAKEDMKVILRLLLNSEGTLPTESKPCSPPVAAALQARDAKSGVTPLGQAVTWGDDEAVPLILKAIYEHGVDLAPLLDCCTEGSRFHKPLFAAVASGYDSALASILKLLSFQHQLPAALLEHAVLGRTGNPGALPAQLCQCAAGPGRGAETVDLLMCAASVGSASITQALIDCGMKPQDTQRFRRNEYYKSAMHAAVEYPGLAMLMCEGSKAAAQKVEGTDSPMPGVKQMRCVEILLKAGAVMTQRQLTIILNALPTLEEPKVARSMWRLVSEHVSVCASCGLLGCWAHCQRCRTSTYCSAKCQKKHWPIHKPSCKT